MIHLTPAMVEAAYNLLKTTPPFRGWRLPESETIEFHVVSTHLLHGWLDYEKRPYKIGVSAKRTGTLNSLIETVAHEMIHLRQVERRTESKNTVHNAEFMRLARRVCAVHGFDAARFI